MRSGIVTDLLMCSSPSLESIVITHHYLQDGSWGGSSREEGRLQPTMWCVGCRHHSCWVGRNPTSNVWPSSHEVNLANPSLTFHFYLLFSFVSRALYLMTKKSFKPPTLQHKNKWSPNFHDFLVQALKKDPRTRPTAHDLLKVLLLFCINIILFTCYSLGFL